MFYKARCPRCEARLSRKEYFSSWRLYFHCRSCGARFRLTLSGYVITSAIVVSYFVYYGLFRAQTMAGPTAIAFILLTMLLALWLLPYVTTMTLRRNDGGDQIPPTA